MQRVHVAETHKKKRKRLISVRVNEPFFFVFLISVKFFYFSYLNDDEWKFDKVSFTYADPGMLQSFAGGDPFAGVHRQHLID